MKNKICIIVSKFYPKISNMLLDGATSEIEKNKKIKYKIFETPGTLEIPTAVSMLVKKYDAFVVLGCVIRGQTSHYDFICSSVFQSLMNLSIEKKIPIGSGILTCENKSQAELRANPHKINKGGAAAQASISLLKIKINEKK